MELSSRTSGRPPDHAALDPRLLTISRIDGLGALASARGHDLFSGHLFAFTSRRGDRVKILCWDRGGFVLYYKRLERGRFRLPEVAPNAEEVQLDATQLAMLLDGIDVKRVQPPKRWTPSGAKK
jgi:transposase